MTVYSKVIMLCILISAVIACNSTKRASSEIVLPPAGEFFDKISDYNIFATNKSNIHPSDHITHYIVTNELFSDYAEKDRYVYIPQGEKAVLREDGFFDWPEGSMLIKNFGYTAEQVGESRMLETRLLIKESETWKAMSYVWNEDQREATIAKVGDIIPMTIDQNGKEHEFEYVVPNKNQCKSCHNYNEKIDPIGFRMANLQNTIEVNGASIGQIEYLESRNIIAPSDDVIPEMPAYTDQDASLQDRALAYLDINCGHCHRPEGPGNTSGLFLQYDETRSNHLGFCKGPVAAGKGSGGRSYDIAPGSADASILHFRMRSTDPSIMMPEIGRSLVHEEGLALITEWIDALEYDCSLQYHPISK